MSDMPSATPFSEWPTDELRAHRESLHDRVLTEADHGDEAAEADAREELQVVLQELISRGEILR